MVCMLFACLLALPSCSNSWIYDDEGDCSVYYRLRFRYDKNLKWADAFANEVTSVHVYAFDKEGLLVWQKEELIEQETAANYSMLLDLPAGDYRLLAWCGLSNDGERSESFSVPEAVVGVTRMEQVQCALNRKRDENGAYSDERLYRLFHGALDVTLPKNEDGGSYEYTMPLTKDTNHIRVILQHLSGEDVDVNDFIFRIDDENGLMASDNNLLPDENINYRPWNTQDGVAGVVKEESRAIVYVKTAIADLTVGRLMANRRDKQILTITSVAKDDEEAREVATIPVTDYALLTKDYYELEYKHSMTDQELLDREDEYVLTILLDKQHKWIASQIYINSWRVVKNDVTLN